MFSAEVSAADASLFMLTTSLAQDLYKRFVNPSSSDERVLLVARCTAVASGVMGVGLAWISEDVIETLKIPYTLITVSLLVPVVAGLYVPRTTSRGALASIAGGVVGMLAVQIATHGAGWGVVTPALAGLTSAIVIWLFSLLAL